ncbi:hypothetical protein LR48_Vigan521s000100 [Vigna angularis]|uniref:Transposase (putative) gypsy type domain-containing protein n=1 Tax=Phaseolus angularis TaxID=3914 RepID=A0A0L9TCP6_PHAAN|nr:hypothetical protein LR48_Vigan521s000100 [Vigna angularis]
MAVVHVESSSESSGRSGERSAGGDGEHGSSPSSVSSSFLEEFVHSPGTEPNFVEADRRIIYGIPIHLLKGGILVDVRLLNRPAQGLSFRGMTGPLTTPVYSRRSMPLRKRCRGESAGCTSFMTQLCVRVPFTEFQTVVFREMNVAPGQLHPNSWAAVQAFLVVCLAVGVSLTILFFFYYFEVRPPPKGGWVSLTFVKDRTLFRPFSDSYKSFKDQFFKVIINAAGRHEFHDAAGNPLFPFYWTRGPRKIKENSVGVLSPTDLEVVRTINALPRRLSARKLVECFHHEDCERKAFEVPERVHRLIGQGLLRPPSSLLLYGGRLQLARCRSPLLIYRSPRPVPPIVLAARGTAAAVNEAVQSLATVFVDPSFEAAIASAAPLVRKRKEHREGEKGRKEKEGSSFRSASKKARKGKEGSSSRPLLGRGGVQSSMSTRAASLAWYLREFADRRGIETVRAELQVDKKKSEGLRATIDQMLLTHDDYDKKIDQLKADLEKAKKELANSTERLDLARKHNDRLEKECRQLKEPYGLGFVIEKDVFNGVLVHLDAPTADEESQEMQDPSSGGVIDQGRRWRMLMRQPRMPRDPGDSGSSKRTLRSPPGQVDSGSVWNSPFINLDFVGPRRQWFFGKNSPFTAQPS